jgi:hypothetical protein
MVDTLAHPDQHRHIKLRPAPWFGVPAEAPRGSQEIPTHAPILILNDSYPECVLVTDGIVTGWVRREYVKLMQTHDRRGQGGHEKTKLRNNASRAEDFVSPVVELTKGMRVALLDGINGMSLVSTIVNGKVCSGWVQTSYLR